MAELAPLARVDVESGQLGARVPADCGRLVVRSGLAGHWLAEEDDLAVQPGDLDGDAGFLAGLAFGALGDGLADLLLTGRVR